jgi:hypothetical protein
MTDTDEIMTDLYIQKRENFRERILLSLDNAAGLATGNPLAMGALDADLPELFRVIDRLFDDAMARNA